MGAIEDATARVQRAGGKQVRERSTKLGGVEMFVFWVLMILGFVALALAILAATMSDWMALAILGPAAIVLGGAGVWLDVAQARRGAARRQGVEIYGLYLTPSVIILRTPRGRTVVPREHVLRFDVRKISPPSESGVRFGLFVEVSSANGPQDLELQDGTDRHQLECCRGWLAGQWPPPLPR